MNFNARSISWLQNFVDKCLDCGLPHIAQDGRTPMMNVHQCQHWRALLVMRHQSRSQQAAAARMARRAGHKLKIS